ncbi:MAG: PD-(D/E)XK nuclease family protein [Treponema sp.]|nr:PD-(D/E)XK nuclease family protein [Treponema sp.]
MESDEAFECLKNIFSEWNRICNDFVNTESSFFNGINPFLEKIRTEKKGHNKNHFNIFSKISEIYCPDKAVYEKENPNSEILRLLLNPNPEEIGDRRVLERFFLFIGMKNYMEFFPDFNDIQILREKHRMDIYIRNEKNAVIIESKLNGAPHQDFQLARYYLKATKGDGLTVKSIVYLTLNPIEKLDLNKLYQPSRLKKYPIKDQKEYYGTVSEIKSLITYISAVGDGENDDLSKFFKKCSEIPDINNERLKFLLKEYSELLEKLAGEERMTSAEKNLIKKIYEDSESIKNALEFIKAWEYKNEALSAIFNDKFKKRIENDKTDWKSYDDYFYKEVNGYNLFTYFHYSRNTTLIQIGFWSGMDKKNKFEKEKRGKLKEVLENLDIDELELKDEPEAEREWVWMDFVYDEDEDINAYFEKIIKVLEGLENKTSQLK